MRPRHGSDTQHALLTRRVPMEFLYSRTTPYTGKTPLPIDCSTVELRPLVCPLPVAKLAKHGGFGVSSQDGCDFVTLSAHMLLFLVHVPKVH
jgi:hypothetical protein